MSSAINWTNYLNIYLVNSVKFYSIGGLSYCGNIARACRQFSAESLQLLLRAAGEDTVAGGHQGNE